MIRSVISLVKAFQSNQSPAGVGAGAAMALYIGLTPITGSHAFFLWLAFFFFRMNKAATLIVLPIVKIFYLLGFAYLADQLGFFLLNQPALYPLWSWVTHAPVLALLNLNHTVVLGGALLAAALTFPVYWLVCRGILAYRKRYAEKVEKWRAIRWLRSLGIVKWIYSWWPKDNA